MKIIEAKDHTSAEGQAGVLVLDNTVDPQTLSLDGVTRVDLNFPKFTDGRAYSQAYLLRRRLGFTGEIRATGDFLLDQIAFMARVGIDAFEVPEAITLELFQRALGEMGFVYQPSTDGRKTIRELRSGS